MRDDPFRDLASFLLVERELLGALAEVVLAACPKVGSKPPMGFRRYVAGNTFITIDVEQHTAVLSAQITALWRRCGMHEGALVAVAHERLRQLRAQLPLCVAALGAHRGPLLVVRAGKTFETLDAGRLPVPILQRLQALATGAFLETATNVLAFGLPGVGKSHALCAVGHALIEAGHSVLFTPAYAVVQELLSAKRDLDLPRALRKIDLFEVILLDDLGYVQQSPEEAEVLFTLLAERYERRSVMVTSNLVFSQWDRIFRDQMATAAAIDRLVHHAVLLEFDVPSYRTDRSRPTPPAPAPRPARRGGRGPGPLVPKRRR
jgi:DNA replication protein DnaC